MGTSGGNARRELVDGSRGSNVRLAKTKESFPSNGSRLYLILSSVIVGGKHIDATLGRQKKTRGESTKLLVSG